MTPAAGTLSGGEQQMLALGRALMAEPRVLLLDEPSLGLAPLLVQQIFRTLAELKAKGVTMLLVEQNINLALDLADRAYVLRTGEVSLEGSAAESEGRLRSGGRGLSGGAAMSLELYIAQQIINAVSLGSLYALVAIGLSMVFGILRMTNFAHGDMMMVGAFATLVLQRGWACRFGWAVVGGIAFGALAGVVVERVAYRPVRGAPDVTLLLTSLAVTYILENLGILIFTSSAAELSAARLDGQRLPAVRRPDHLHPDQSADRRPDRRVARGARLVRHPHRCRPRHARGGRGYGCGASGRPRRQPADRRRLRDRLGLCRASPASCGPRSPAWSSRTMGFTPLLKAFVAAIIGGFGSIAGALIGGYLLGALEDPHRRLPAIGDLALSRRHRLHPADRLPAVPAQRPAEAHAGDEAVSRPAALPRHACASSC